MVNKEKVPPTGAAAKSKPQKALGLDPFADMEDLTWGQDELFSKPNQETTARSLDKTEIEPEFEPTIAEVEPPVEREAANEQTPVEVEPPVKIEMAEAETIALAPEETGAGPETEKSKIQNPKSKIQNESHFLDELIAVIDEDMEQTFGSGVMADLAAVAPEDQESMGEQHLIFTLAGTDYAVPITNVTEVGQPLRFTGVPNTPDWMLGVVNLRGDIISMVDLRTFLGMEQIGYEQTNRMLVARANQEEMTAGLIVDRVKGIRYLPVEQIASPAAPIEDKITPYLRGVYQYEGYLLAVLDFDRLLLSPEMRQFESM